ncbi:Hypothetical predicted protein, partial [Pelobates cultripes]
TPATGDQSRRRSGLSKSGAMSFPIGEYVDVRRPSGHAMWCSDRTEIQLQGS